MCQEPGMQRSFRILSGFSLLAVGMLALSACKTRQTRSALESVEIPQTPVKNKMKIGFCWAYATTDFLESEYKKSVGGTLNLSEEALGFYRIAEHLMEILATKTDPAEISEYIGCQRFQGLHILKLHDSQRSGGLELAESYGVLPEEVYSVKFESEDQRSDTFWGIRERMKILMAEKPLSKITREDIETRVIVRPEGSPTRASSFTTVPPASFLWQGKTWTPKEFYNKHLNIKPTDFVKFEFKSEADYPKLVQLVKKTLAAGTSVPFGFGVDRNHLFQEDGATVFSGKRTVAGPNPSDDPYAPAADALKAAGCPPKKMREYAQGKHAVIITDFVNKGGREGAFESQQKLDAEVAKSADELAYLKIKNNWGIDEEGDEDGSAWLSSKDGYYRVDREYLIGHLRNGVSLNITVPRAIAEGIGQ